MISIRALSEDDWAVWRFLRLQALAEAPGAFGSTLAEWSGEGDTEARWRTRLRACPHNLVAAIEGALIGMASATSPTDGEIELISMWVAPDARGRGAGDSLIDAILRWAGEHGASQLTLDVREGNTHAISLYERHGFRDVGRSPLPESEPPERRMVRSVHDAVD